ncbi:MAG TPA: exodeoxyribonuclease VII small subunit [Candidatus Saccharimonadales bacterium]|nr:exodeoxyribonuclease VII small subunit [Candidatus Saccharimonadales bacterium]
MAVTKKNYQQLSNELDEILNQLQDSDVPIDDALELYERGGKVLKELETYLRTAKNHVELIGAHEVTE